MSNETSITLIDKVSDWVVSQALTNVDLETLIDGTCERLAAAGVPLARVNFTFFILHPLYGAKSYRWRSRKGTETIGHRHEGKTENDNEDYTQSPFFHLAKHGIDHLRRRLTSISAADFPVLETLYKEGITDYLAFTQRFEDGEGKGMFSSWASDQKSGFSESDLAAIFRVQKRLSVTAKIAVLKDLAQNTVSTYLGNSAGTRVMDGQIRRGDGETIRAAIVMGDIRGSTTMAEELGRQGYIDAINTFFDNVAGAFSDSGGEILSFMGDGFLAIFPCYNNTPKERTEACRKAIHAAFVATNQMAAANSQRVIKGEAAINYGLGLHAGNVLFGNVGLEDRLTFSVFGSAVNEAARLESLSKEFDSHIITSEDFRMRCEGNWQSFGKQKLRGLGKEVEIFAPAKDEWKTLTCKGPRTSTAKPLSDAENVVLLQQAKSA